MTLARRARGVWAEELVARYYRSLGFEIVARNFRFVGGELDIVAISGRLVAICEVKARANTSHGFPAEAVTPQKQMRIRKGAVEFLRTSDLQGVRLRFDVACVLGTRLEMITDAF